MRIVVTGQEIKVSDVGRLVAGSVGQYECHCTVSGADWEGYQIFVEFADSRYKRIIEHTMTGMDETFAIPWEALEKPGMIRVGIWGILNGLQRPAVWSNEIDVVTGTTHGEAEKEPTQTPWEIMVGWIGKLDELDTETKASLVAAINEVLSRFQSLDHRDLTHREDEDQHPIEAITGLLEALRAKYEKPSGGIPANDLSQIVREALVAAIGAVQPDDLAQVATSGEYSDLKNTPAPYDDTEVKNRLNAIEAQEPTWSGKYSKPSAGIPKTDLAAAVQASLGKADSALQEAPTAEEVQYDPEEEHTEGSVAAELAQQSSEIAQLSDLGLSIVDGKINITYEEALA